MNRREFVVLGATALWLPAARAQQPRRIGFLRLAPPDPTQLADFRAGLEETGYAEGRNLVIEYRYADGDYARLAELAADLVRQSVEVVVTAGGTDAVRAAMRATSTIPIVGTSVEPGRSSTAPPRQALQPPGRQCDRGLAWRRLVPEANADPGGDGTRCGHQRVDEPDPYPTQAQPRGNGARWSGALCETCYRDRIH